MAARNQYPESRAACVAVSSCLGNQDRRQGRDLQLHAVLLNIMQTMKQAGWQEMCTVKACDMKACARTRASHVQRNAYLDPHTLHDCWASAKIHADC